MAHHLLARYARWLHTQWPAGTVERLPETREDFSTAVRGLFIAGDLTGVPLLKFAADSGARVAQALTPQHQATPDLIIIGAGVAGMAAALEAQARGLSFVVLEASQAFSTIVNFPKGKPIYTYPQDMIPRGALQVSASVKEGLVSELHEQTRAVPVREGRVERVERRDALLICHLAGGEELAALNVLVAIGRSGNFRKLGVPGEELDKVYNRLHDPKDHAGKQALVVGGGDSAIEAAVALAAAGAQVTLSYRKPELSRPKPENVAALRASSVTLRLNTQVQEIRADAVVLRAAPGTTETLPNDVVFALIGREPPLDFFRRSGVPIQGETRPLGYALLALLLLFCTFLYLWKSGGPTEHWLDPFPERLSAWLTAQWADRATLLGTLAVSLRSRSFYYTLLYSTCITLFGIQRMRRRRTPYVTAQTLTLIAVQIVPLFVLPEILLPWLGYNGAFQHGVGKTIGDHLFELYIPAADDLARRWPEWGHPRAYWRAYGIILAWPLNVYNVFTDKPMVWWLVICALQTFVLLPLLIWRFGKGVYCGWICSCGALAETMGDQQRHKMPHGPGWNRLNMLGQVILAIAFVLLAVRVAGWLWPGSFAERVFPLLLDGKRDGKLVNPLSYKWVVDILLGGILGVGLYFKYSGRVWCRFACPLAALMHIYARFSRFRIFADKKKCISCNVCTSVCHMGIDVMSFANKGLPMQDPECVRCSACVQSCPTGVLQFGALGKDKDGPRLDKLPASPVLIQLRRNPNAPQASRPARAPEAA